MQIYNSLTKQKEEFKPVDGKTVRIYACGPTVYDLSHLGHARAFIVWDVIQRYLRFIGYEVIFVRNVTDIDDKIIKKAKEAGKTPEQIARKYLFEFWKDMDALNVAIPDYEPRATEFVLQMIEFIRDLIKKEKAYESNGDVYFSVQASTNYGQLSKQDLNELQAGSREQARSQAVLEERKRHPADFALWKKTDLDTDISEISWASPWGQGRPGWHLECSTMIKHVLGETIDLHGGGEDLLFPHHENEIAQSEALHGKPLSRFWVHNSFVQINSEKMAKSLGNFNTIRDVLKSYSADEVRLFVLTNHYRTPIDFSEEALQAAKSAMQRLIRAAYSAGSIPGNVPGSAGILPASNPVIKKFHEEFTQAMENDFNTSVALACLFGLAETISKTKDETEKGQLASCLHHYAGILGFTLEDTRQSLSPHTTNKLMDLVLNLRQEARKKKDFATSDLIRDHLSNCGISVMDTTSGANWEVS